MRLSPFMPMKREFEAEVVPEASFGGWGPSPHPPRKRKKEKKEKEKEKKREKERREL